MTTGEIREAYLAFFEERGHLRLPSASLIPPPEDTSTLLTVAGMQPFKPYFRGEARPPGPRVVDSQKCFRTPDIAEVGNTLRHLTFFEMLGNWSFGDYFKEQSIAWGLELSVDVFGLDRDLIWVSVFGGDEELGLGPDTEAIELWKASGIPAERIVELPRAENFWQGGATGPCGPCAELYLDRGEEFGEPGDRPGDDSDRYLEYWNHVFMSYELHEDGSLTPLPENNIDTGMGLERMAVVLQGVESVFDTDSHRPLIDLAEELSGRAYGPDAAATRSMRIVADHAKGASFLIADGVVPSNEERGYVLRRVLRRALQQGRTLGLSSPWLGAFAERTIEMMSGAYPELAERRQTIQRWIAAEEESFARTLDRGSVLLARLVAEAKEKGASWIGAEDAFQLHDTYGFPYELTRELLAEEGLSVDDAGFERLMDRQRERARSGAGDGGAEGHRAVLAFARTATPTSFVGYETLHARTSVIASERCNGSGLLKLEESPFYPEGGGQVADSGLLRWEGGEAAVEEVYRLGEDQALRVASAPDPGTLVEAAVDHEARHATMRNHTATHLLHAALRECLGDHVRQAGSAVRPDKLRFDFTHGAALSADEIRDVEGRVNQWVKASRAVRAMQMERDAAEALGAMALFGEKYGDWVRVVEVDDVSRELCGGTHVKNTAEIGIFKVVGEGSSAANVRRIEALTGPAAIDWFQARSAALDEAGELLGSPRDALAGARRAAARLSDLEGVAAEAGKRAAGEAAAGLAEGAADVAGVKVLAGRVDGVDGKALGELADRVAAKLGTAAVVLGGADGEKAVLAARFTREVVERGLNAGEVIGEAAGIIGGGGGGRDDSAEAGGREPQRLGEALDAARSAVERGLEA